MSRERKRKHDDAHYPLGGKGKRANRQRSYGRPPLVPSDPNEPLESFLARIHTATEPK